MRVLRAGVVCCVAFALAASCSWAAGPLSRGSLEGTWRLVEQTHGSGQVNRVADRPALRIEFVRDDGRLTARARPVDGGPSPTGWPSLLTGEARAEPRPAEVVISPAEDGVRASYRAAAAPGEAIGLEIIEDYRVTEDGKALVGTMTVSFVRDGKRGGSHVLRRRFEREW